jgi:hypothetical protein
MALGFVTQGHFVFFEIRKRKAQLSLSRKAPLEPLSPGFHLKKYHQINIVQISTRPSELNEELQ